MARPGLARGLFCYCFGVKPPFESVFHPFLAWYRPVRVSTLFVLLFGIAVKACLSGGSHHLSLSRATKNSTTVVLWLLVLYGLHSPATWVAVRTSDIAMARPGGSGCNQRACYSGHKRFHYLVYQTITTPDGLIFSLYGPEVGRRHDLTLLRNSGISERLQNCLTIGDRHYYIYGDAAYVLRPWLLTCVWQLIGATKIWNSFWQGTNIAVSCRLGVFPFHCFISEVPYF